MENIHRKQNNLGFIRKLEEESDINEIDDNNDDFDEEYNNDDDFDDNDDNIEKEEEEERIQPLNISLILLQTKIVQKNLILYALLDNQFPNDIFLTANILLTISNPSKNLNIKTEMDIFFTKRGYLTNNIAEFAIFGENDDNLQEYLEEYQSEEKRIIVNKIGISDTSYYYKGYERFIYFKANLGDYTDSNILPNINYSLYLNLYDYTDYDIYLYKIQEISSCNNEYKFNFTLNKNMGSNQTGINIIFKRIGGNKDYEIIAKCNLSSEYNDKIPCQVDEEILNYNFTLVSHFIIDKNKTTIIYLSTENDFIFPLYCFEKPPFVGIILFSSIFFVIIIAVIITIFIFNKKDRGEKEYKSPNNNSNNIIGLSAGDISK